MGESTTLARLDVETRLHHADADRGWRRFFEGSVTRDDYIRRLIITYGFEAPYEAACAYTPGLAEVIDLRGRRRSGLIAQDLLVLGWNPQSVTRMPCYSLVSFGDVAEALAWMYVVERATLLHQRVRDALVVQVADVGGAIAYLSAYDHLATRRWAELGVALDRTCSTPAVRQHVVATARDAFGHYIAWQRSHDVGLRITG